MHRPIRVGLAFVGNCPPIAENESLQGWSLDARGWCRRSLGGKGLELGGYSGSLLELFYLTRAVSGRSGTAVAPMELAGQKLGSG